MARPPSARCAVFRRAMDDFVLQTIGEIGRHPDVIKAAIAASNEEKNKSLRPLKSDYAIERAQ